MLNKVILIGNLGADPEVRTLESGVKVARIRIATTERVKQGEEWKDHTEWHSIVLWRNLADIADKYLRKGSRVFIEGKIRQGEYVDKDNIKRYTHEIFADTLKLLDRREGEQHSNTEPGGREMSSTVRGIQEAAQRGDTLAARQGKQVYNPELPPLPDSEDDLPF